MTMSKKLMLAALGLTIALGAAATAPTDAAAKGFSRGGGGGKMLARGGGQRELIVRRPVREIADLKKVERRRIELPAELAKRRLVREGVKKELADGGKKAVEQDLRRATTRGRI
jgi:hypothetical protein